jgi:hypothetical protein
VDFGEVAPAVDINGYTIWYNSLSDLGCVNSSSYFRLDISGASRVLTAA